MRLYLMFEFVGLSLLCLALIGIVIILSLKQKNQDEISMLKFYPALVKYYTEECPVINDDPFIDENDNLVIPERRIAKCEMRNYGISDDGDPYIEITYRDFDKESGTYSSDSKYMTIWFHESDVMPDGVRGYAKAVEIK